MVKLLKKIIFKAYVIGLMIFTIWYGHFMYPLIFGFEGKEEAASAFDHDDSQTTDEEKMFEQLITEQTQRKTTDLGYRVLDQPYIQGRFHHIGFNIQKDKASICVNCHGNVPHDKSREVRSFLNMHTFYLACETCHSLPKTEQEPWEFRWYNKDNGSIVSNPQSLITIEKKQATEQAKPEYPVYGNYGAKIAPAIKTSNKVELLHGEKEMAFSNRYKIEQDKLSAQKKSQMKKVIHRKVSKKPVQCKQCHQQEAPYLPFAELGYPPTRERELTNVGVVGMIKKYKTFYIPKFLNPGGIKKE